MVLQEKLERLKAERCPLPLMPDEAMEQAKRLRVRGMTYTNIAMVMVVYHGVHRTGPAWQMALRRAGMPPKHYRNGPRSLRP